MLNAAEPVVSSVCVPSSVVPSRKVDSTMGELLLLLTFAIRVSTCTRSQWKQMDQRSRRWDSSHGHRHRG